MYKSPALLKTASKEFSEWQTLNKWVYSFGTILAELLHQRRLGKCVEEAKTVLTPYGGRLEYNIEGIKFHVHLKNAERVQKGKRWSMVMYLYYLIGYKIDACKVSVNGDRVTKENSFVLALDGDVDFQLGCHGSAPIFHILDFQNTEFLPYFPKFGFYSKVLAIWFLGRHAWPWCSVLFAIS